MPIIIREPCSLPDDLEIASVAERCLGLGKVVRGRVRGFEFEALVYAEHARNSMWEYGCSRITALTLRRDEDVVFRWGGGQHIEANDPAVEEAVAMIAAYLADRMYPDLCES